VAKKTSRPGRTLTIFFLCVVALYGLAALGQTWKPNLGLDLEGGTRITLTAVGTPSATKLSQAANIVDARVNGSGVSESAVSTQGGRNVVVEIPGKNAQNLVDVAKRTAQLRFRLVASGSPQPGQPLTTTPTPSGTASPSSKASPTKKPTAQQSASSKPRPAPAFAVQKTKKATAKSTATPTPTPTPAATPTTPATTGAGASPDNPMQWVANPGTAWQTKFAAFQCPAKGSQKPVDDSPSQPLITCDGQGNKYLLSKAIIEGTDLKDASYGTPPNGIGWAVNLSFKSAATKAFANTTTALNQNGGLFAIVLDGKVLSAPGVSNGPILDGNAQITGSFTQTQAQSLANSLKYGALPVKFQNPPSVETIGPSLAGNQLSAGVYAGIVGLLLVMLYCLLYYRGLGLVVIASLIVAGAITYATVLVLSHAAGFTLTLPGIAGLIVAVGITADSFIVYFERIRDEMRDGKSMRVAVEAGWVRARNTCLAADGVSFLAAVVLYIFAIGVVKGFAFALGISTIIDVVVFFWFTKPTMTLLARRRFFASGSRYSGLSPATLGIDGDPRLVGGQA
jgi:preprotein translocase subunit SecD